MKKILRQIKDARLLIAFVLIAACLWYISRLSHRYSALIELPVEITTSYESNQWVEDSHMTVRANVSGDGRLLALARLGMFPRTKLSASELKFRPTDQPYLYRLDQTALRRALQKANSRLTINYIVDSMQTIVLSPLVTKQVPILNNVMIRPAKQFMIVGGTQLEADSVEIKAPQLILDTLTGIPTEVLHFESVKSSLRDKVALVLPTTTVSTVKEVTYSADVTGFTEMDFHLPITVRNAPAGTRSLIIPMTATIKVRVPLDKFSHAVRPQVWINYLDRTQHTAMFPVYIDSLPRGADLILVEPQFVEPFFEIVK